MNLMPEVNRDLLLDFVDESLESLGAVESLFVKMELSPDDTTLVEKIFRPVHSIKGNAAYFGLMRVKEISHRMESVLDLVRQGKRRPDHDLGNTLLRGLDALRTLLGRVRDEQPETERPEEFGRLLDDLDLLCAKPAVPAGSRSQVVSDAFFREMKGFVDTLPPGYQTTDRALLDHFRPETGSSQVSAGLEALTRMLTDSDPHRFAPGRETAVFEALDVLLVSSDAATKAALQEIKDIARTFASCAVGLDALARDLLLEKLGAIDVAPPPPEPPPAAPVPVAPAPVLAVATVKSESVPDDLPRKESRERTMRIPEASMDRFLDQVGELMGLEEQFRYLGKRMLVSNDPEEIATDLRQAVEQFGHLSSKLSGSVLELRRTEARPLLQKVPRLCRDVAESTGKKIEVRTLGEDVRIDKAYLDLLDAPLMHMVRNACDHGIETPEKRASQGKAESGVVVVTVMELEESVVLRVEDDGRGLDTEGLHRKAIELGLVKPEAPFGEIEMIQVLCRSGVSTAATVTDISGRGVGMDVVKREIEGAGGRIEVRTTPGKGSVFLVSLPRAITTRITDGFLFRSGKDRFVVPMRVVVETFPTGVCKVSRLPDGSTTVLFRNEILRLVDSAQLLETPLTPGMEGVFVRLRAREEQCVLRVEEVLGVQRTVIKPVDEICRSGGLFAGAALVGDGGLAMVLGEDGLSDWLRTGA